LLLLYLQSLCLLRKMSLLQLVTILVMILKMKMQSLPNVTDSNNKEGKYMSLFSVVNFPNIACTTTTGYNGTCTASSECIGTGGTALGSCAQGFGTCCYYHLRACGGSVTNNQTYLQSPSWPDSYTISSDKTCTYTFYKISTNVCQIRLDFAQFELGPPISNNVKCAESGTVTDYVSLVHSAGTTTREETTHLCGYNTGYHVYLDMGAVGTSPSTNAYIEFKLDSTNWASYARKWNVMASQIECDSTYHAPHGCLQYYFGNSGSGTVEAFNYNNPSSSYIGHLSGDYTVCIRKESSKCVIGWTPPQYSADKYGLSISGASISQKSRGSCRNPSPGPAATTCTNQFIRIPDATQSITGGGPYTITTDPSLVSCDRMCGKKLCLGRGICDSTGDHAVVYSKKVPFELQVNFDPAGGFPQTQENKGFKLHYFQLPC